jgi:hypothetical protein
LRFASFFIDVSDEEKRSLRTEIYVRELNGYDEETLSELRDIPEISRVTSLLRRIISFNSSEIAPNGLDSILSNMTLGERAYILIQLRKIIFGSHLDCVVTCPLCNKRMSLELNLDGILNSYQLPTEKEHTTMIDGYSITVRPIITDDLTEFISKNDTNPLKQPHSEALDKMEAILRRCITSSDPPLPDSNLDNDFMNKVSSLLNDIDPFAEILLDLDCPECKSKFELPFHIEHFVIDEIDLALNQHEREVHWLALNYNWSEASILELPVTKRKRYVQLINNTLSGESV